MSSSTDITTDTDDIEASGSLTKLAQETSEEIQRARAELAEINVLIKQTSSEMERANARAAEVSGKLREIEVASDNYTRAEIREIYVAAQEAEMRSFLMQGQLELLEYKRQSLERYDAQLQRFVDATREALANSAMDVNPAAEGASEPAIIMRPVDDHPVRTRDQLLRLKATDQDMGKIIDAQEDERLRIARRIHDGPAQALANLILRAEICERLLINEPEVAKTELTGLKGMVVDTLREIRQFIFDLRPMILDDLGLIPTLRRYSDSLSKRTGTSIKLSISGPERRLPSPVEIALFRIAQEAIDNSIAHGKATEVQVRIEMADKLIRLSAEDNGTGFEVDKPISSINASGLYGLTGMKERAQALGGRISLDSKPGQGTRLHVEVPL